MKKLVVCFSVVPRNAVLKSAELTSPLHSLLNDVEASKALAWSLAVLKSANLTTPFHQLLKNDEASEVVRILLGSGATKDGNETSNELSGHRTPAMDEHAANGLLHCLEHTSITGTCVSTL